MTPTRRLTWELTLAVVGLAALAIWSGARLRSARQAALAAAEDVAACQQIAARIAVLRDRPAVAGVQERASAETATRVERAAAAAHITASRSLVSISPEPPRRLGETAYKEAPTQVLLRDVTLRQLVTFLSAVCGEGSGLRPKLLRLSAPRAEAVDTWSAEVTLCDLIYSPRAEAQTERGG